MSEVMDGKVGFGPDDFDEMYDALGADNLEELQRSYTHVLAEMNAEALQRLERMLKARRAGGDDDGLGPIIIPIPNNRPPAGGGHRPWSYA